LQVPEQSDALLDAPAVGGVAELLDDGAIEPVERLAAMEEPGIGKPQATGGEVDDGRVRSRRA